MPLSPLDGEPTGFGVGAAVRYLRDKKGMSARALSIDSGLSEAYVNKLEAGRLQPSLRAFARIAKAIDMEAGEIWVIVMHEAVASNATTDSRSARAQSVTVSPPDQNGGQ